MRRKNEEAFLVFVPKNESGFVSHFANLTGFENISGGGQLEILPYITGKAEYLQYEEGDPFHDGKSYIPGVGADLKTGIGSNLNLNATINPDFGQVEIDPAVINLSDVETFYQEKRPFFIEGSTIFDFGMVERVIIGDSIGVEQIFSTAGELGDNHRAVYLMMLITQIIRLERIFLLPQN